MTVPSSNTPRAPQRTVTTGLRRADDSRCDIGLHPSSWSLGSRHAVDSRAKETIRTSEAPQVNSHSGIGRSCRPTSAWPRMSRASNESAGVDDDLGEGDVPVRPVSLELED